jgi:L-ascorbate metabolism protein UlaG (beta-lactamase superfamily)
MTRKKMFFKQNILAEPLFNQWYAWPALIPPVSASMYVANSHLKIMQSFVSAPQMHVSALKNPAMMGGPFISYAPDKVPAIKRLIDKTLTEHKLTIELAEAVKALDQLLLSEASGYSMEALYPKVPELLKGYVELVYDLHDNPSIRFLESLLYRSKFYNTGSQSVLLSESNGDTRPFAFSTPRLESDESLSLNVPFESRALDELFMMKSTPRPLEHIKDVLSIPPERADLFDSFFTEKEPDRPRRFDGDGVQIRYLGHACLLIETKDVNLLIDPVISYKSDDETNRHTFANLPDKIDYVLITHTHQDHLVLETLLQLRHKVGNILVPRSAGGTMTDPSVRLILRIMGFNNVWELDELEQVEIPGGYIMGCPFLGEHGDLDVRTKLAYYVSLQGKTVLAVADSNSLESSLYRHFHEIVGDIDILFLGMECEGAPLSWLYGPLLTKPTTWKNDQSRRFDGSNCEKGLAMIGIMKPKQVYVYAMGQEPWCSFLTSIRYTEASKPIVESNRLVAECLAQGLAAERLYGHKVISLCADQLKC